MESDLYLMMLPVPQYPLHAVIQPCFYFIKSLEISSDLPFWAEHPCTERINPLHLLFQKGFFSIYEPLIECPYMPLYV